MLYPHQIPAFLYTLRQDHPALLMEMRLGKTLVAIRRISLYPPRADRLRVLVVAPNSALGSWADDLGAESIPFTVLRGERVRREKLLRADATSWFLINKEGFLALPELCYVKWDAVVLDESTFIKNPTAAVSRYYTENFRSVPHRWILTGTPNPESDLDLYSQYQWLDGHFLGYSDYWRFRFSLFVETPVGWKPRRGSKDRVAAALGERSFILSREQAGYFTDAVSERRTLELPQGIRRAYERLERDFELELPPDYYRGTIWATTKYLWLRRLCNGFTAEGEMIWRGKVEELRRILREELQGQQAVIWFTHLAEMRYAREALGSGSAILDGSVSMPDRDAIRERFQRGEVRWLLSQTEVSRMGMDLSAADVAIYFNLPLSYLTYRQTKDRIVSLKKNRTLLYLYLMVENSVDEDAWLTICSKGQKSGQTLSRALETSLRARRRHR